VSNLALRYSNFGSVEEDAAKGILPDPDISIVEHAQKNLFLVSGKNPFPGLVDFSRTPYLYEILDSLMPDNGIEKVVLMKGWQTGGTLAALAWMLWVMDISPAAMLIVQPNDELRTKFSKQRIAPIVANCGSLQGKIKELEVYRQGKNREKDTILTKLFPGGFLNLGTSKAAVSLRSDSIQYVVFDEVSAYDEDCQGEGDPCGLAIGRTSAYEGRKKLFYVSTPSLVDRCRIEREYKTTDQRKLFVPCLNCGELQLIIWEQFDLSGLEPTFLCIKCSYRHYEQDKTHMLKGGLWVPTATPASDDVRGYHLPALYAPPGMYSWKSCRTQYQAGLTDNVEMKVFVNNCKAVTFSDTSIKSLDADDIRNLREDYDPDAVLPAGIGVVTAGVDTHPSHIDIVTRGWGRGAESWILHHWVIYGDANREETWALVDQKLRTLYTHHLGQKLRIAATCVDTGGHSTGAVYEFCRDRLADFVLPIKGSGAVSAPIIDKPTTKKEARVFLWPVGKLTTHGRLFSAIGASLEQRKLWLKALESTPSQPYSHPGIIHLHSGLSDGFCKELAAPKAVWVKREGQWVLTYETTAGVADHGHDCVRYSDAAREFLDLNIDEICDQLEGVKNADA
jgi:phage terminase large subunit GpA-like protein